MSATIFASFIARSTCANCAWMVLPWTLFMCVSVDQQFVAHLAYISINISHIAKY